ncbi:MAG: hypothetical protein Q8Q49_02270 [bacterium]|nr:hypothetical protein [bacterium]
MAEQQVGQEAILKKTTKPERPTPRSLDVWTNARLTRAEAWRKMIQQGKWGK